MMLRPFRTNYRVWTFVALCLFLTLGFVDPMEGATWKGGNTFWSHIGILLRREYICSTTELLIMIMFRTLIQAVPAVVLGWVLQAFVVVLWSVLRRKPTNPDDMEQRLRLTRLLRENSYADTYPRQVMEIDVLNKEGKELLLKSLAAQKKDAEAEKLRQIFGDK